MNNQRLQNQSLDVFLVSVNARDLVGNYIVPKPDVAVRLTVEIERITHVEGRNLAGETGVEKAEKWVSALPGRFITETQLAVNGICVLLRQKAAKTFEIAFHNTTDQRNLWGDQVLLAVRYEEGRSPVAVEPPRVHGP